jgi:hypothetical protein
MKEDGNPFSGEGAKDIIKKIEELKKKDIGQFYDLVFVSIINFSDAAVLDNSPVKNKIQALNKIIDHFKDLEEYEKCAALKKILDRIESNG